MTGWRNATPTCPYHAASMFRREAFKPMLKTYQNEKTEEERADRVGQLEVGELDYDCRDEHTDRLHQVTYDVHECRTNVQIIDVIVGMLVVVVDTVHCDRNTGLEASRFVLKVRVKTELSLAQSCRNHMPVRLTVFMTV